MSVNCVCFIGKLKCLHRPQSRYESRHSKQSSKMFRSTMPMGFCVLLCMGNFQQVAEEILALSQAKGYKVLTHIEDLCHQDSNIHCHHI